jgi:hypothetical protein
MTAVRVKGFQIFEDRHGKWRCYHRKTGTKIDLSKAPLGSAEFFAECARLIEFAKSMTPKPGTLGLLIAAYRAHTAFQDLAPRTQSDYQRVFDYLKPIADTSLMRFDRPLVVRIRDKAAEKKGRKFGNDLKARLSMVFGGGPSADTPQPIPPAASRIFGARREHPTPIGRGVMPSAASWWRLCRSICCRRLH